MNTNLFKKTFLLTVLCAFCFSVMAFEVPSLQGKALHDKAMILNEVERESLEEKLLTINTNKDFEIACLIVSSLDSTSIEEASIKVAETWKIGKAKADTGLIIFISLLEKAIRFEVGYGLEGILTDAKCGLIIRNIIVPAFEKGEYYTGLNNAIDTIVSELKDNISVKKEKSLIGLWIFLGVLVVFVVIVVLLIVFTKNKAPSTRPARQKVSLVEDDNEDPDRVDKRKTKNEKNYSAGGGKFGGGGATGKW